MPCRHLAANSYATGRTSRPADAEIQPRSAVRSSVAAAKNIHRKKMQVTSANADVAKATSRLCVPTGVVVYSYMQSLHQIRFDVGFELVGGELEAKGMTAPKTNVFRPQAAGSVNRDVMTKHHTSDGMSDHLEICLCFKKRVSASACVFSCGRAFFDYVNSMAQEPADIVNFLFELITAGIRVGTYFEK